MFFTVQIRYLMRYLLQQLVLQRLTIVKFITEFKLNEVVRFHVFDLFVYTLDVLIMLLFMWTLVHKYLLLQSK